MSLGISEWRAIAIGWGAGLVALMVIAELNWMVPTIATVAALTAAILWRTDT